MGNGDFPSVWCHDIAQVHLYPLSHFHEFHLFVVLPALALPTRMDSLNEAESNEAISLVPGYFKLAMSSMAQGIPGTTRISRIWTRRALL